MDTKTNLFIATATLALLVGACNSGGNVLSENKKPEMEMAERNVLDMVIAGDWRGGQKARDIYRHPKETFEFFGLAPGQIVMEVFPGGGWYTNILAPYVHKTGGTYIAIGFEDSLGERYAQSNTRFTEKFADREIYGTITQVGLGPTSGPLADGNVDLIVSFRNLHNWMGAGYAEKAFSDFYTALKPGGILGIVEHRLPESREQDPKAGSGYVQVSYTKAVAAEAGFEFFGASEINANPKDTADHPFGVWTLPPAGHTAPRGEAPNPDFDTAKYRAIGESDRFTMKFRKPE